MGIADPTGFNFLTNLMNTVGGAATKGLAAKNPVGLKTQQQTFGALGNAPSTVLPGGGTLDSGIERQSAFEELPSAELPMYQGERDYKMGLAGLEGGTANLGAQQEVLGQQYRTQLMSIIGPILEKLGIPVAGANTLTGGGGILMKLLSGVQ